MQLKARSADALTRDTLDASASFGRASGTRSCQARPISIQSKHSYHSNRGLRYPPAKLLYLPPYSPDFNPIERLFAKLKALLRRPPNAPSRRSGTASRDFLMRSYPTNAQTTSETPDMLRSKWKPL
jgi:hypothetical protein